MKNLLSQIDEKKQLLEQFPALNKGTQKRLNDWLKVELIFSSNAIAGNTLSRTETAEIIEKDGDAIVPNRPLKDVIGVQNHSKALDAVIQISNEKVHHRHISERDILTLHKYILTGINDRRAGRYRESVTPIKKADANSTPLIAVPYQMDEFFKWLKDTRNIHPVVTAIEAHTRLFSICPFVEGNGRTARLLLNLILLINGYPLTAISSKIHTAYLNAMKEVQTHNDLQPITKIVAEAVLTSLEKYVSIARGEITFKTEKKRANQLFKIGDLAKQTGETVHTLRYWTKLGLIKVKAYTVGGYFLYSEDSIKTIKAIRRLQSKKRLTLQEIRKKL